MSEKAVKCFEYGCDLYFAIEGETGFAEFHYDNAKDLRMWRLEPQTVNFALLTKTIEDAIEQGGSGFVVLKRILTDLETQGAKLINIGW